MTTIDKIIAHLTATSPQPQAVSDIATATGISASTLRKNLKRMREGDDWTIEHRKDGNSTVYWLPQAENGTTDSKPTIEAEKPEQPAAIEPAVEPTIEADKPEQPSAVEPKPEVIIETPEATFVANPATTSNAAPRALMAKLRNRIAKNKARKDDPSISVAKRRKARIRYKKGRARLAALVAKHGE